MNHIDQHIEESWKKDLVLFENDLANQDESQDELQGFLEVGIRNEHYVIALPSIRQIIAVPQYAKLPNVPKYIMGIFNLRGNIESLIDTSELLGVSGESYSCTKRVVIVENLDLVTGMLVDSIGTLVEAPSKYIETPVFSKMDTDKSLVSGQLNIENKIIAILDIPLVLKKSRL